MSKKNKEKGKKKNQVTECFLSHCSDDEKIMSRLSDILNKYLLKEIEIFNTFDVKHTTMLGESRSDEIKKHLKNSSVMIAVITDSYLRSPICISELSAFWYQSKKIIPFIFNGDIGKDFLIKIFGDDRICIDSELFKAEENDFAQIVLNSMKTVGLIANSNDENTKKAFDSFFKECRQQEPARKFIGMSDYYDRILRYCNDFGIQQFKNSKMPQELINSFSNADEIMILSTTGAGLIHTLYPEFIPRALEKGINFTILIPDKYSDFLGDVACMESVPISQEGGTPSLEFPGSIEKYERLQKKNISRLHDEFQSVLKKLKIAIENTNCPDSKKLGHIYVGCAFNSLRQTITLAKKGDHAWGWASITIPPKKASEGTPSLEFSGSVKESSMAKLLYEHVQAVAQIAKHRSAWVEIISDDNPDKISSEINPNTFSFFPENEKDKAKDEWQKLYDIAQKNMEESESTGSGILIEVAAQHPLNPDGSPAPEFAARLDTAVGLYNRLVSEKKAVSIYVPGSLHQYEGKPDPISLSEAGTNYLISKGIPEENLHGKYANDFYKGKKGVYNSADECFVASKLFFDEHYKQLYCICSPNQLMRKQLFYIAFGVIPLMLSVPCNELAHGLIYEVFSSIPNLLLKDHTWQAEDSIDGLRTRRDRDPNFSEK